ncbi:hypothetical protein LIER_28176 [Lithospermum erythrorhizon]|uniref:Uncharacterized protein n=1 Tax=Lithospermum erythrorhizon TaxID=34254 RepID=A0AAV3RGB0_LITER
MGNNKAHNDNSTPTFNLLTPETDGTQLEKIESLRSSNAEEKSHPEGQSQSEEQEEEDEESSSSQSKEEDESQSEESETRKPPLRILTRCSPSSIISLTQELKKKDKKLKQLEIAGFKDLLGLQLTRLPIDFVNWLWLNFDKKEVVIKLDRCRHLPITEEDVRRVYNLPRGKKIIDLKSCPEELCNKLKAELKLIGTQNTVTTNVLYTTLSSCKTLSTWTKAAIMYIIGTLFNRKSNFSVSL